MDLFEAAHDPMTYAPLATRMRPRTPDEFVGQDHLFGPGKPLREILERRLLVSFVLWGPPGTGKTTIARLLAERAHAELVMLSAVSEGVPRLREVVKQARERVRLHNQRTVLLVDEVHRALPAFQDALLPHIEDGTIVFIGATTENVSFELRPALLSRAQVFQLRPLSPESILALLDRALTDAERGLGGKALRAEASALDHLAHGASGDARTALTALEFAAGMVGEGGVITHESVREALGVAVVRHDKAGDAHYDVSSALIKSIRGSDPDAACYWLVRMLAGGDVAMVLRRLLISAAEDVGMADPQALPITQAAVEAYDRIGAPEGDIILAEAVVYLATAPKSKRSYLALMAAREAVARHPNAPVPLHLRNAVTSVMEALGYGDYENPFDSPDHFSPQPYLPDELQSMRFYNPSEFGYEKTVTRRMDWWRQRREEATRKQRDG